MKRLLTLAAILSSLSSFGQKLEVGVNGGVSSNSNPTITSDQHPGGGPTGFAGVFPAASLKLLNNVSHWQYGVQLDYRQLAYKSDNMPLFILVVPEARVPSHRVFISKAAFTASVVGNRKWSLKHFDMYAGASAGYMLAMKNSDPYALAEQYYNHINGNGLAAGVQAGSTWFVTKRVGINAELGGDFVWMTLGDATYKMVDFQVTVGVRYKL